MKKFISLLLILSLTCSMLSPSGSITVLAADIPQEQQEQQTTVTVPVKTENCEIYTPEGEHISSSVERALGSNLAFRVVPLEGCEPGVIQIGSSAVTADPEETYTATVAQGLEIIAKCTDVTPPVLSAPVRTEKSWSETATYTFTATDNVGIVSAKLTNSAGVETQIPANQDGSYSAIISENGTYTITVADAAGKAVSTAITENKIDTSIPTITKLERQTEEFAKEALYLLKTEDPESGIDKVTIQESGKEETKLPPQDDGSYLIAVTSGNIFTVTVFNAAGGTATRQITDTSVDITAPEIQNLQREEAGWQKEKATYRFIISDLLSGAAAVRFGLEGSTYENIQADSDGAYCVVVSDNGTYVIEASDALGNTAKVTFTESQIDHTAPSLSASRVEESWSKSASYIILASDPESGISDVFAEGVDGNLIPGIQQSDGSYHLTLTKNGEYTIAAANAAGYTTKALLSETKIDAAAPVIGTVERLSDQWKQEALYSFDVSDEGSGVAEVRVKIGSEEAVPITPSEGKYLFTVNSNETFEISAKDTAGNSDVFTGAESMVDNTAPSVSQPIRTESGWSDTSSYTFQVEDSQSGIQDVILTLPGGRSISLIPINNTYRFTLTSNSSYTIIVSDTVGNVATVTGNEDKIDSEKPEISTPKRNTSGWTTSAIYTFQVSDPGSGIHSISVTVNGKPAQFKEENGVYTFQADENGIIKICAADNLNHEETIQVTENMIDTAKPEISGLSRTEGDWTTSAAYTFQTKDSLSGVNSVKLTVGNEEPVLLTGINGVYTFTMVKNAAFQIEVLDAAGNAATTSGTEQYVDTAAPEITSEIVRDKEGWATSSIYTFSVQDAQAGIQSVRYRLNNSESILISPNEKGQYQFPAKENGTYTVTVADRVGNVLEKVVTESWIDTTAPSILTPERAEISWSTSAIYTFRVDDSQSGIAGVFVQIGGNVPEKLTSKNGIYEFTLQENTAAKIIAMDAVGNNAAIGIEEILVDTSTPEIHQPVRKEQSWAYSAEYTIEIVDLQSGVAAVTVQPCNGDAIVLSANEDGSYTYVATTNGSYVITATDLVGNHTSLTFTEEYIDVTVPSITDITRDLPSWSRKAVYSFRAADNLSGLDKICVAQNGKELELTKNEDGSYSFLATENDTYIITAIDAVGNSTSIAVGEKLIDVYAPEIQSVAPQESWHPSQNTVLFKIRDNGELASVEVRGSNGKDIAVYGKEGKFYAVITENGEYIVTAADEAGNTASQGFTVWHIDTKEPSKPVLSSSANEQWVNTNVKITASATDDQSGVAAYWYCIENTPFDTSTWKKLVFADGSGTLELTEEQNVDYYIVAQDEAGRISEAKKIHVSIDKTAPTNFNASYLTGEYTGYNRIVGGTYIYNDRFGFHAEAKDSDSGVARYEFRTVGIASGSSEWTSLASDESGISPVLTGLQDDNYSVLVRVYDLAGNCSSEFTITKDGESFRHILENTPIADAARSPVPTVALDTQSGVYDSQWTSESVTVTLDGSSAVSGIEYYEYSVDNIDPDKADLPWSKVPFQDGKFQLLLDQDTNAFYSFRAVSYAGNYSKTISQAIKIQKTAPTARTLTKEAATGSNGWYTKYPSYTVNSAQQNPYSAPVHYIFSYTHNGVTNPEFYYDEKNAPTVAEAGVWDITIIAEDAAGNRATVPASTAHFDVDVTPPSGLSVLDGSENIASIRIGTGYTWNYVNSLDVIQQTGLTVFHNESVSIQVNANGGESGVAAIFYQVVAENTMYSQSGPWTQIPANGLHLEPNSKCRLFFKAVDGAGNITYFASKGIVMDNVAPDTQVLTADTANLSKDGFYYGDVTVHYAVEEPAIGKDSALAGLMAVTYRVLRDGVETQSGQLYPGSGTVTSTKDGLVNTCTSSFVIDAQKNNSNNIVVELNAIDMAGNKTTTYISQGNIKIDVDTPSMVSHYNRNDVKATVGTDMIFTGSRTLTVIATERNFNAGASFVQVTDTDTGRTENYKWTSDGDTHTAVIQIEQDGHYSVDATIVDSAGNKTSNMGFVDGTQAATAFVIDNTDPVISVSYDNNNVQNEKYFAASRTATIQVNERNFDPEKMNITMTFTSENGNTNPISVSQWQHDGSTHWATIHCRGSGIYSLSISGSDAVGNAAEHVSFTGQSPHDFVVDTHITAPKFEGIQEGAAYSGKVIPTVTLSDANLEDLNIKVLRTRRNEIRKDVTTQILKDGYLKEIGNVAAFAIFDVFLEEEAYDGIYTIQASGRDKAGNTCTSEITFSINRFGSVYVYDETLIAVNGTSLQKLEQDLIVTEYNASGLVKGSARVYITVDGSPISDPIYTVIPSADGTEKPGDSGWYEYQYVISKENFTRDGQYEIVISTKDAAGNIPENTTEATAIRFSIDTTAPELPIIQGLEKSIYKADSIPVTVSAADNVLLDRVIVYIDGVEVACWDNIDSYIYENIFSVPSGLNQHIRIVVTDKAGNILDTDSDNFAPGYEFQDTITVSTNFFLRFYANKPLFYGSVAGAFGILLLLLIFKKRRKDKK